MRIRSKSVQKRMDVMKEIKGAMGVLGGKAIAFDESAAQNTLIEWDGGRHV